MDGKSNKEKVKRKNDTLLSTKIPHFRQDTHRF